MMHNLLNLKEVKPTALLAGCSLWSLREKKNQYLKPVLRRKRVVYFSIGTQPRKDTSRKIMFTLLACFCPAMGNSGFTGKLLVWCVVVCHYAIMDVMVSKWSMNFDCLAWLTNVRGAKFPNDFR